MGINNPKDNGGQTGQLDRGPDRTAGPGARQDSWTGDLPDAGRTPAGPPGNRIGSALATEMHYRAHAASLARTQRKRNRNRFPGSGAV